MTCFRSLYMMSQIETHFIHQNYRPFQHTIHAVQKHKRGHFFLQIWAMCVSPATCKNVFVLSYIESHTHLHSGCAENRMGCHGMSASSSWSSLRRGSKQAYSYDTLNGFPEATVRRFMVLVENPIFH